MKNKTTYFKQFNNCDELNNYIENLPSACNIVTWQMVKLCTGDTVIVAQFEIKSTVIKG